MNNENKEQETPPAIEPKQKKSGIWATCAGKIAALWKSGTKGKIICIVGMLVVLGIIGAFTGDEEGGGGSGGSWKYTGENISDVFWGFPKDEGVVYRHSPSLFASITVLQATKKGNLVTSGDADRLVWVETKRRYEDDEELAGGFYIRRGSYEYTTALGAEKTVARYVEVTDKGILAKIQKQIEEEKAAAEKARQEAEAKRKAEEAERKAEEEARAAQRRAEEEAKKQARVKAAEQGAYELDIPIKSLCGFKLGVPPSQVQHLFQNDDGTPVQDFVWKVLQGWCAGGGRENQYAVKYRLAKPFRLFSHAVVTFYDRGVGLHLDQVTLMADITDVSEESRTKEFTTLVELIEKKFKIKFNNMSVSWRKGSWQDRGSGIRIYTGSVKEGGQRLTLEYDGHLALYNLDKVAQKAQEEAGKKTINLDATVGADEL